MRGLIGALVCLVLVIGTMVPGHGAHAMPSEPAHQSQSHDGHAGMAADAEDASCEPENCEHDHAAMACFSVAGHCIAALPGTPGSDAPLTPLAEAGRIAASDRQETGTRPETDTPPPRV